MRNVTKKTVIALPLFLAGTLYAETTRDITFELKNSKESPDKALQFNLETIDGKNIFTVQVGKTDKKGYWHKSETMPSTVPTYRYILYVLDHKKNRKEALIFTGKYYEDRKKWYVIELLGYKAQGFFEGKSVTLDLSSKKDSPLDLTIK